MWCAKWQDYTGPFPFFACCVIWFIFHVCSPSVLPAFVVRSQDPSASNRNFASLLRCWCTPTDPAFRYPTFLSSRSLRRSYLVYPGFRWPFFIQICLSVSKDKCTGSLGVHTYMLIKTLLMAIVCEYSLLSVFTQSHVELVSYAVTSAGGRCVLPWQRVPLVGVVVPAIQIRRIFFIMENDAIGFSPRRGWLWLSDASLLFFVSQLLM